MPNDTRVRQRPGDARHLQDGRAHEEASWQRRHRRTRGLVLRPWCQRGLALRPEERRAGRVHRLLSFVLRHRQLFIPSDMLGAACRRGRAAVSRA